MSNVITSLWKFIWGALKYLVGFLTVLFLSLLGALLYALPWILRVAVLLGWLASGYVAITCIEEIYSQHVSSPIPVLALQFAIMIVMVAWVMLGMMQKGKDAIWGLLAAGGIVMGSFFGKIVPWVLARWPLHAELVIRVMPSSLFIVLLIVITIRLKWLRTINMEKISNKGGDATRR